MEQDRQDKIPDYIGANTTLYDRWNASRGQPIAVAGPSSHRIFLSETVYQITPNINNNKTNKETSKQGLKANNQHISNTISTHNFQSEDHTKRAKNHHKHKNNNQPAYALQWNLNGYWSKYNDLEILINEFQPRFIALQEVHKVTTERLDGSLGGRYKWVAKIGTNQYHSVAIGVQTSTPFSEVIIDTELPIVAVKTFDPNPLTIYSFYLPVNKIINLRQKLLEIFQNTHGPILILGNSTVTTQRGEAQRMIKESKKKLIPWKKAT
jgi:hypothetical protein